jgi:hypothetical protein
MQLLQGCTLHLQALQGGEPSTSGAARRAGGRRRGRGHSTRLRTKLRRPLAASTKAERAAWQAAISSGMQRRVHCAR